MLRNSEFSYICLYLYTCTFSTSLFIGLQVNAVLNKSKRARREAVAMLKAAAKKTGSTQLLALAASAGLDAFTKVIVLFCIFVPTKFPMMIREQSAIFRGIFLVLIVEHL